MVDVDLPKYKLHQKVSDAEYNKLLPKVRKYYEAGVSVRQLALAMGRSYGFAYKAVKNSGATFRPRGRERPGTPRPMGKNGKS